ncbi:hypothetical protein [Bdellovibrio bacteriovorus]|uniref:hypothetical protein n=1 Tax=Bdellovibrio bacteriovorus TaxID=959 RepID=UPI00045C09D6|nr:hypothetical protein [Bdellovibrio bacteriovorus]AHZ84128.1 hypothetical protein EP01_04115 [Bdellovibrio bacteriovorus]BEV68011.1 hypothetical protein Bb109J_c1431 [Bdellovibrio bacteriovorus]
MKKFVLALLLVLPFSAQANQDLVLDGERWLAKFTAYVCDDGNTQTATPVDISSRNIIFTTASADYSLDNILLKATYTEGDSTCNYSTLMLADNALWTVSLSQSKAYATSGTSDCSEGKAYLDQLLAKNDYKYLHGRVAVYVPVSDAADLCDSDKVGIHIQVTGRVK